MVSSGAGGSKPAGSRPPCWARDLHPIVADRGYIYALSAPGQQSYIPSQRPFVRSLAPADRMGLWRTAPRFARSRRGAALAEYALLIALVFVGLVGLLFGMQSHLRNIFTKADNQMGVADCAVSTGSCSVASSGGGNTGQSGGSGSSAASSSGSAGSGSGSGSGSVLGAGDETPTNGPDVSAGSGGGSGGSQPQPGIQVPPQ
jgi:Flp pilus assembly pilin Flp